MNSTWRREARRSMRIQRSPGVRHADPGIGHGTRVWLVDLPRPGSGNKRLRSAWRCRRINCDLHPDRIGDFDEHDVSTARKTPTQKTSSDRWPHLMSGRNIGHSRPHQSRGRNLVLDAPRSLLLNLRNHDGDLGRHAATVHALANLAHTTWVHSAIHELPKSCSGIVRTTIRRWRNWRCCSDWAKMLTSPETLLIAIIAVPFMGSCLAALLPANARNAEAYLAGTRRCHCSRVGDCNLPARHQWRDPPIQRRLGS